MFYLINKVTRECRDYNSSFNLSAYLLGRQTSNFIVVKSVEGVDQVVPIDPNMSVFPGILDNA